MKKLRNAIQKRTKRQKSNANTEVAEEFTSKYNRRPKIDKEFMVKAKGTESRTVLSPSLKHYITAEERIEKQAQ
jgi:hypothetical protein